MAEKKLEINYISNKDLLKSDIEYSVKLLFWKCPIKDQITYNSEILNTIELNFMNRKVHIIH